MAQQVKVPATKAKDQGLVPGPTSGTSVCTNNFVLQFIFFNTESIVI